MERWRYVFVAPASAGRPPNVKREGWGSGRALRPEWVVRVTPAGRAAQEIWPPLFDEIDTRWANRFGVEAVDELRGSLRSVVDRLDVELPEYVPIVAGSDGMAAGFSPRQRGAAGESRGHLSALLSQALLAYTLDFEHESELSLPLSSNFVRVLDETGLHVSALPRAAAVSKEATSMALTFLTKAGHVDVAGTSAATKRARLTARGLEVQKGLRGRHDQVERAWRTRFGARDVHGSDCRSRACLPITTSLEGCIRTPAAGARASPTSNRPRRCWRTRARRCRITPWCCTEVAGPTAAEHAPDPL